MKCVYFLKSREFTKKTNSNPRDLAASPSSHISRLISFKNRTRVIPSRSFWNKIWLKKKLIVYLSKFTRIKYDLYHNWDKARLPFLILTWNSTCESNFKRKYWGYSTCKSNFLGFSLVSRNEFARTEEFESHGFFCSYFVLFAISVKKSVRDLQLYILTDGEDERINAYWDYYKPYELTTLDELYCLSMTHSIRYLSHVQFY